MNIDFLASTFLELLGAVPTTLSLVSISLTLGFVLAIGLALMKTSKSKTLQTVASVYIYYFRGTPLLVQMYLLYFGIGSILSSNIWIKDSILWYIVSEPYWYAIIALMFNTAGYTAEILRGAIQNIPSGQVDAGVALGLSKYNILRHVILPQAFRLALPAYSNEVLLMVKGSSLASIITVMEIMGVMSRLRAETYAVYELIILAGIIYLGINYLITLAFKHLERHLEIPS